MVGHGAQMCANVGLLAVSDRAVDEREPVIELLRGLDRLFWMESMGGNISVRGGEIRSGGSRYLAEFPADSRRGWTGRRARLFYAELDVWYEGGA